VAYQRCNDEIVIAREFVETPQLRAQPDEDAQAGNDDEKPV